MLKILLRVKRAGFSEMVFKRECENEAHTEKEREKSEGTPGPEFLKISHLFF